MSQSSFFGVDSVPLVRPALPFVFFASVYDYVHFPYVHLLALLTDMALCVNSATVGLQTGRILLDYTSRAEVPLLLICAFVRVAVFVLIYSGLLAISVHLENPLGDDPADLPALAYQVWMKKECESFQSGVDAIDLEGVVDGRKWWEGLSKESDKKERSQ